MHTSQRWKLAESPNQHGSKSGCCVIGEPLWQWGQRLLKTLFDLIMKVIGI